MKNTLQMYRNNFNLQVFRAFYYQFLTLLKFSPVPFKVYWQDLGV